MRKIFARRTLVVLAALALTGCASGSSDPAPEPSPDGATPSTTRAAGADPAAELHRRIDAGEITGLPPVHYRCEPDSKPLTTVFYNEFDPPAAVLTWGDQQVTLFGEPMASGIRYTGDGVTYAEHQQQVDVDFRGTELSCTAQ